MDDPRSIVEADLETIATSELPWNRLEGSTVLLTGSTGLVGGYIVEALAARTRIGGGRPIRLLLPVRSVEEAAQRFAALDTRYLRFVDYRFDRPLAIDEDAEFVIHAASAALPTQFAADPVGSYLPNVIGTHHLLAWSVEHRVSRFAFISSGAVHGLVTTPGPSYGEGDFGPLDPLEDYACYAESKRMGETECLSWFRQFGLETVIARLGHTYGPGLRRSDTRSFAEFVFAVVDGHDIVLRSDGDARRPFCYLTDAVTGVLTVLLDGVAGGAYFVLNDEAVLSIRALAEMIIRLSPRPGLAVRRDPQTGPDNHLSTARDPVMPTAERLRSLRWRAVVPPEEGFARTVAWHLHAGV
jgi:nucleoside-diphosphate-sugar epimerase